MKTGKTLVELATEIQRQRETKRDFVANTTLAEMIADPLQGLRLNLRDQDQFGINDLGHRQIGAHVGVPASYYDRMKAAQPALLAANVNCWLHSDPERRLIRTLDGNVRAFLSDRYRPLENADLAEAVLPVLMDMDLMIISSEVTEKRFYLKCVDRRIERDIPTGAKMGDGGHTIFDTLSPAITISNSEVGFGALSVETGVWTRQCTNLATFTQKSMRKYHVGGKHDLTEGLVHLLSDATRRLTDQAVWVQVGDVVRGAFDQAKFDASVEEMCGMAEQPITGDIVKVVDLTAKQFELGDGEKKSVLDHLIRGGDFTRHGLFNSLTRTAEDLADYDRATDFERLGGKLIELPQSEWKVLAEAA